jgi:hypothetical protein
MRYPVKKVFITQEFGANPANYAKWGYKGHNGIDYRAFNPDGSRCYVGGKSEVFAPHSGKIIENAMDANGYGWYTKIENAVEGSILAHFSEKCSRAIGENVNEGDFLAFQGTTGNSTGIHLHHGYYRHPRNRQNGYGGMIDQTPYLVEPTISIDDPKIVSLQKEVNDKNLHIGSLEKQIAELIGGKKQLTEQNYVLSSDLGIKTSEAKSNFDEVQKRDEIIRGLNETIIKIEATDNFAGAAKDAEDKVDEISKLLWDTLIAWSDILKYSIGSDIVTDIISGLTEALQKLVQSTDILNGKVKTLESEIKRLNKYKIGIDKLNTKDVLLILVRKLLKRS